MFNMKLLVIFFVSTTVSFPVFAAPATPDRQSPNPRSNEAILNPTFNKEACCKCWNDLYHNGVSWEVPHRPRPCDGDCTCDWCGTNNANASYGTPCAGAGSPGNWGYCLANCDATPSGISATQPNIIKTLPPTTLPTEHPTSIIMTLPPTTLTEHPSSIIKTLPPTTLSTETSISKSHEHTDTSATKGTPPIPTHNTGPPPELKEKRQDQTITITDQPIFTTTETGLPIITDTSIPNPDPSYPPDTTLFFPTGTDSISLVPTETSSWNGGTTIGNTGTLTFSGGTQTFTYGSETLTFIFPPDPTGIFSPRNLDHEERQFGDGGEWTTDSILPASTSWYGGGPGFSLTFSAEPADATSDIESEGGEEEEGENVIIIEKRQIDTITWGESTLPATTYWGGDQTITIGGETITFGSPPGGLTFTNDEPEITASPEIIDEEKRQVGVIITGGPWTEDNGATFTDYWGYPGEVVTLVGPHGDETITLSGTPRHITATVTGVVEARTTAK